MRVPKIRFHYLDWMEKRLGYGFKFRKYWSGQIWDFSVYKYQMTFDFRGGFKITDLLVNDKERSRFNMLMDLFKRKN